MNKINSIEGIPINRRLTFQTKKYYGFLDVVLDKLTNKDNNLNAKDEKKPQYYKAIEAATNSKDKKWHDLMSGFTHFAAIHTGVSFRKWNGRGGSAEDFTYFLIIHMLGHNYGVKHGTGESGFMTPGSRVPITPMSELIGDTPYNRWLLFNIKTFMYHNGVQKKW